MLKCGIIDHHLNNFHADKFISLLHGELAGLDIRITYAYESNPTGEKNWCGENDVQRCDSQEMVVDKSDVLMVLSPDNIGEHLTLGEKACQSGKRVYIDKYLAETYTDAKQIASLCKESNTDFISSSALRFAVEFEEFLSKNNFESIDNMFVRGPGSWPQYACHALAPAMRLIGQKVEKVVNTGSKDASIVTLALSDGRTVLVEVRDFSDSHDLFPWQIGMGKDSNYTIFEVADGAGFYRNLMRHVATWFKNGKTDITTEEMLKTVWVLESAVKSREKKGEWIEYPND